MHQPHNDAVRLLIVRHGNTFEAGETAYQVGAKTDLALTKKGLEQAESFAIYLKSRKINPQLIICGSLKRQIETAEILQTHFPEAILQKQEMALDEIDYGVWEGLTADAIEKQWPEEYKSWNERAVWPEGIFVENHAFYLERLEKWIQKMAGSEEKVVLAVSSNGLLRMLLEFVPPLWKSILSESRMKNYKVATGNYCDLSLHKTLPLLRIRDWNMKPQTESK